MGDNIGGAADTGISEGDYTEWVHKWTKTLPGGLEYSEGLSIEIDETHGVINIGYSDTTSYQRFGIFNISDFSTVFISTASQNFHDAGFYMNGTGIDLQLVDEDLGFSRSLISYILIARADNKTIEVFRSGTSALWSRNIQNDESGQTMGGMMMSNLGKYIIVATAQKNLLLYEGS